MMVVVVMMVVLLTRRCQTSKECSSAGFRTTFSKLHWNVNCAGSLLGRTTNRSTTLHLFPHTTEQYAVASTSTYKACSPKQWQHNTLFLQHCIYNFLIMYLNLFLSNSSVPNDGSHNALLNKLRMFETFQICQWNAKMASTVILSFSSYGLFQMTWCTPNDVEIKNLESLAAT